MSNKNQQANTVKVKEHDLKCPVCSNDRFYMGTAQLNTSVATFFNLDWANKSATYFLCSECTHISWFLSNKDIKIG